MTDTDNAVQVEAKATVYYVNADGSKDVKGRGRTRLGYVKGDDGDYHVDPDFDAVAHKAGQQKPAENHFYITLDNEGNEIDRTQVGRGRPKKGFERQEDGNFLRTLEAETEAETAETADVTDVADTDDNSTVADVADVADVELTDDAFVDVSDNMMVDDIVTE